MTEYEVKMLADGNWVVESTDWNGEIHRTMFTLNGTIFGGPLAAEREQVYRELNLVGTRELRARAYAAHMNKANAKHISYPDE